MNHWMTILKPMLLIVATALWWSRRHRFAPRTWMLGAQLCIASLMECYAAFLSAQHRLNLWVYDLYAPLEYTLLLAYVHAHLSRRWHRLVVLPAWLLVMGAYTMDLRAHYPDGFVSGAYITGSLVLVIAFLTLLYDLALQVEVAMYRQPLFWSGLGMVLFFAGMVPVMGLWNRLTEEDEGLASDLYTANDVLFLLRYGGIVAACAVRGLSAPR